MRKTTPDMRKAKENSTNHCPKSFALKAAQAFAQGFTCLAFFVHNSWKFSTGFWLCGAASFKKPQGNIIHHWLKMPKILGPKQAKASSAV